MEEKKTADTATSEKEVAETVDTATTETENPETPKNESTADDTPHVPATTSVEVDAEVTNESTPANSATSQSVWKQYTIAALVIVLMGGGLVYALEQQGRINVGLTSFFSSLQSQSPVARVNGVVITQAQYDQNFTQITLSAQQQGANVTDPDVQNEIKTQALDVLINTELLRQAAAETGIVTDASAIDERYQEIVASVGGEDVLFARMGELGITPESLRSDIEGELLVQQLIAAEIDTSAVEISDEEVSAFYEQVGGAAALPPLSEVRPQIEEQLRFTAEQELVAEYIESLRTAATVEILI